MHKYFVSIGSNINPHQNVIGALHHLFDLAPQLHLSRIIETEPSGGVAGSNFLNFTVCLYSPENEFDLKSEFNQIETTMGRNRDDVDKKKQSRTIDLDILFALDPEETRVEKHLIPQESYLSQTLLELLYFLNIEVSLPPPVLPEGIELFMETIAIGKSPITLSKQVDTHLIYVGE